MTNFEAAKYYSGVFEEISKNFSGDHFAKGAVCTDLIFRQFRLLLNQRSRNFFCITFFVNLSLTAGFQRLSHQISVVMVRTLHEYTCFSRYILVLDITYLLAL